MDICSPTTTDHFDVYRLDWQTHERDHGRRAELIRLEMRAQAACRFPKSMRRMQAWRIVSHPAPGYPEARTIVDCRADPMTVHMGS